MIESHPTTIIDWLQRAQAIQIDADRTLGPGQVTIAIIFDSRLTDIDDLMEEADRLDMDWTLDQHCRICGCTDNETCPGGCYWSDVALCSACFGGEQPPTP